MLALLFLNIFFPIALSSSYIFLTDCTIRVRQVIGRCFPCSLFFYYLYCKYVNNFVSDMCIMSCVIDTFCNIKKYYDSYLVNHTCWHEYISAFTILYFLTSCPPTICASFSLHTNEHILIYISWILMHNVISQIYNKPTKL